jgi:hypothetical protein
MPRFVILDHDHPFPHWDFFLEAGEVLRGWRLLSEPCRSNAIVAEALPNHRLLYLDYEGEVSGGRGRVLRWDCGSFEWISDVGHEVRVQLNGQRVSGVVTLRRSADDLWTWE